MKNDDDDDDEISFLSLPKSLARSERAYPF